MTTDTTLHDRLLELAKRHEDVRDALGIPSDYYVDQFEIDLLKQAAAALIEGETEVKAMKPIALVVLLHGCAAVAVWCVVTFLIEVTK